MIRSNLISSDKNSSKESEYSALHIHRLYPFLFEETLYIVISKNNLINRQTFSKNGFYKKNSFLKIKRIVKTIRLDSQDNSVHFHKLGNYISSKQKNKHLNCLISHSITKILDGSKWHKNKNDTYKILKGISHQYSSIHATLCSIEYKWQSYGSILEGKIPSILHPEIIIRIIRKKFQDVAFIHLFRELLHKNILSSINDNPFDQTFGKKLVILLFNWYIVEYEKFFLLEIPRLLVQINSLKTYSSNELSLFKKMKVFNSFKKNKVKENSEIRINICDIQEKKPSFSYMIDSNIYQYIRTKNIWFLNLQITSKTIQIFQRRYINFLRYRIGYTNELSDWKSKIIENSTLFLGHILHLRVKETFIRIYINSCHLRTYITKKSIFILNPLLWIIRILATYRFCTYYGYPISKSGWSTYSDVIIINRFNRIKNSLLKYYSGSINQKDLSQINHILHYSCAKTLACKHKTNLRKIWQKYGKNISIGYQIEKNRRYFQILAKNSNKSARIRNRFWNFYYKQPDPITIVLQKIYHSKAS